MDSIHLIIVEIVENLVHLLFSSFLWKDLWLEEMDERSEKGVVLAGTVSSLY